MIFNEGFSIKESFKTYFVPILLAVTVLRLLRNKFRPSLWKIPGPPVAAYTALWRLYDVRRGHAERTAIELHRKYGSLVRIGPNHVSVGDAREISNIYGLKAGFTKTAFYPIQCISWQKKPQMNLFSTRDEQYHRDQKRPVANAYSMTSLLAKEDAVDSCTMLFMEKLAGFATEKTPVDLGAWLQYYAFDVVGEFSFAKKLGFLEKGTDVDGMMEAIEGMLAYASQCGQIPEMHPVLLGNPLFPLLMPSMETWNQVLQFTLKAVNSVAPQASLKRDGELDVEALDAKGDMLSRWSAVKMSDPQKINTRDIIVHLSTNVFAGSDTTAIALRAIIYFLIRNPDKMKKLVSQIDKAALSGKLSQPIKYKEAITHLPYLDAVIKEAMRLHPSVGLLLERHVPSGGAKICGQYIPGGTVVGINAWVTQHDPTVYPDPEKFIPERWLESSEEQLKQMEQSFFAFGAGSRTCIGKNISLMEMTKIIPQLLREFEVTLTYPDREWKTKNSWFVQQEGLICNLVKRR
ncbi:putative cytochrome P450 pisatin demethylase [Glonium stellatum]|uniref:Putative cytochrome P450 pisatin demethylase n=1 Tax=Glonium stellatum TaxID=574774 RepID=A0A8E2JZD0_9PEZI|nr:putative cytochrome P450 pisatin demethylase [Glonium stellatum]